MDRFALESFMRIAEKAYTASSDSENLFYCFKLDGFIDALFFSGVISARQHSFLIGFSISLQLHRSSLVFPTSLNAGPVMPSSIIRERSASA